MSSIPLRPSSGTHLLIDASNCDFTVINQLGMKGVRDRLVSLIQHFSFTVMGEKFVQFDAPNAFTGMVVLAESHVSIHTWPELQEIKMDIYVCNVSCDNSQKAMDLYEAIKTSLLRSETVKVQKILR